MTSKERMYGSKIADQIYFIRKLDFLGINKRYTGYFMLVDLLDILVNQEKRVVSFSKEVYPIIAIKYNKKDTTVERNIRNLIDKCWCEELRVKLNSTIEYGTKPTCRDFIFMIRDFILQEITAKSV